MATLGMRDVSDGGMLQLVMSATGAGLTLANSGIGQSVIALAQAGRHHHVLTTTLASCAREVAAKRVPRSTPTWWSPSARTWATRLPRHTASHHRTQAV